MLCIWRIRVHVIILWNSCMAIGYFFRWSNSWTSIDGRKNLVTYFCIILLIIHVSECLNPYIYLNSCIEMCGYLLFSILFLLKIHPCILTTGMFKTFLEQKCRCVLCLSDIEFSWSQCFSFYGIQARNITLDNWYYSIFYILITKSNAVEEKMIWLYNIVRKCLLGFNQQDDSD